MVASTVLFAASYTLTKVALRDIPPFTLGLVRFALAAVLLAGLGMARRRPRGAEFRRIAWAGSLGVTAYFALENLGVQWATATDAALLVAAYPALALLVETIVTRSLPQRALLAGLVVTALGVVMVVHGAGAAPDVEAPRRLAGDLLLIGSGLAWAGYTLISRRLVTHRPALQVVAWQDGIGALLFVPLAALEAPDWSPPQHLAATAAAVAVLVVGCSIAAMALYNRALVGLRPSVAVNALNLVPLWGVLIAVTFLGERLHLSQLVGALVVLAGVSITHRKATQ